LKKVRIFSNVVRGEKEEKKDEKKKHGDQFKLFVFCEKATGVAQFRAASAGEFEFSLDRLAGLFAMQCLVRGYEPNDFVVLVPAEKEIAGKLVSRAKDLLEEGRAVAGPTCLSPRQKEILHSVLCNRANKEIASRLNITVRTVKFHISCLLSKFGVDNRMDLARRAAGLLRPAVLDGGNALAPNAAGMEHARGAEDHGEVRPGPVKAGFRVEHKVRSVRFPGRVATA
jgi:DNA-binding CsgD family transcriptional regulator